MNEIALSMLCFEEEGQWVCIVLEMDLYGYGETKELAVEDAKDHVEMQLSFAQYKNDPNLAWRSAPMQYMTLYADLRASSLRDQATTTSSGRKDYLIGGMPMPEPHVIAELSKGFALENA